MPVTGRVLSIDHEELLAAQFAPFAAERFCGIGGRPT
jgi:hypothetical protein